MPLFVAVGLEVAEPVAPVGPEPPEAAAGWEAAVEEAEPVSPVLVLPDWAVAAPELPDVAVGLMVTVEAPPLPPLAEPVATPAPPVPVTIWAPAGRTASISAAAANRKATATEAARRAAAGMADVVETTFTLFTTIGFTAMGKSANRRS